MATIQLDRDKVNDIIKACIADRTFAKRACQQVLVEGHHDLDLTLGEIHLTDAEYGEFAERFSAEVEPTLWTSKRLKE